jgi:hypothetical protein
MPVLHHPDFGPLAGSTRRLRWKTSIWGGDCEVRRAREALDLTRARLTTARKFDEFGDWFAFRHPRKM